MSPTIKTHVPNFAAHQNRFGLSLVAEFARIRAVESIRFPEFLQLRLQPRLNGSESLQAGKRYFDAK